MNNKELTPILGRIILPALLTIALFMVTAFGVFLPSLEESYLARKRESLKNLVATINSSLVSRQADVSQGFLTRENAQAVALHRLRGLRYGEEGKDYFWVLTREGRLLMHPYRTDLEGKTLSQYADPEVDQAISLMVDTCAKNSHGFIHYQWQWKDEPARHEEKISYVSRFEPWNWIIGTGLYVDDVKQDIAAIRSGLVWTFTGIILAVGALSVLVSWQWFGAETKRRRAERALVENRLVEHQRAEAHVRKLQQSDKMITLGTLVAGIAHEINNPNSSIAGEAHNLKEIWGVLAPYLDRAVEAEEDLAIGAMPYSEVRAELPKIFESISGSSARIAKIIDRLREFSLPSRATECDALDLNDAVRTALALARKYTEEATKTLTVDLHPEAILVLGARNALEHLCLNLMVNACQALTSTAQGIRVETRIADSGEEAVLTIQDEGAGIQPEHLARIYDPFFTTKRDCGGTGLGLSIVTSIAAEHKGEVVVASEVGKGTTFTVILPLKRDLRSSTTLEHSQARKMEFNS